MKAFAPALMGSLSLPNRFVRSATFEGLANAQGLCSPQLTKLLVRLAAAKVGLIITGQTAVSEEGRTGVRGLCLWEENHLPALIDLASQVHAAGGKIMLQLGHAGIAAEPSLTGRATFAPMIMPNADGSVCRPMSRADIRKITSSFARSALLAKEAGFDGIQLHAAHGYLLSSFLSSHYNQRRDEYGGTVENRARLPMEVLHSVREAVGDDFPVLAKINVNDFLPQGAGVTEMVQTAMMLARGGVTAIELSGGTLRSGNLQPSRRGPISRENEGYYKEEARYFRDKIAVPIILSGGLRSLDVIEEILQSGLCDFVAMSRPFICEPELIQRWQQGDTSASMCKSDNLCFRPVRAGKGLYCLTRVQENKKLSNEPVS